MEHTCILLCRRKKRRGDQYGVSRNINCARLGNLGSQKDFKKQLNDFTKEHAVGFVCFVVVVWGGLNIKL